MMRASLYMVNQKTVNVAKSESTDTPPNQLFSVSEVEYTDFY